MSRKTVHNALGLSNAQGCFGRASKLPATSRRPSPCLQSVANKGVIIWERLEAQKSLVWLSNTFYGNAFPKSRHMGLSLCA